MTIQAAIFDLDGTLVDSLGDIAESSNHVLAQGGYPTHSLTAYRQFVGGGARVLVERALPKTARDQIDTVLTAFGHHYVENLIVRTAPYVGIHELLQELDHRGVPMAILSNKPHFMVTQIAEHFFGHIRFVGVHGQKPDVPKKPDPTAVLELSREMNLPPSSIAYVGDSDVDIDTAHAAGMMAVGVAWGFRGRAELEAHNAAAILETASELLEIVDGRPQATRS